jgi:tetratricopeptide (TPR) repeat protein
MPPHRHTLLTAVLLVLIAPGPASPMEFIERYSHSAGEADSKLSCRTVALIEVKRLLLEKIGTYLESRTEIQEFGLVRDQVVSLAAGIVKLEILSETWDGARYQLTARIEAVPEEVARELSALQSHRAKLENAQRLQAINDEALGRIEEMQARLEQLQSDLLRVNQDANASEGLLNSWGLMEKGVELRQSGKTGQAIECLNAVIQSNPTPLAFLERGLALLETKRYDAAIADLTEVLKLQPNMRSALFHRGLAYNRSGKPGLGRRDMEAAAQLGNRRAMKWLADHPPRHGTQKRDAHLP